MHQGCGRKRPHPILDFLVTLLPRGQLRDFGKLPPCGFKAKTLEEKGISFPGEPGVTLGIHVAFKMFQAEICLTGFFPEASSTFYQILKTWFVFWGFFFFASAKMVK